MVCLQGKTSPHFLNRTLTNYAFDPTTVDFPFSNIDKSDGDDDEEQRQIQIQAKLAQDQDNGSNHSKKQFKFY